MEGVRASLVTKVRVWAAADEAIASDEDDHELICSSNDDNVAIADHSRDAQTGERIYFSDEEVPALIPIDLRHHSPAQEPTRNRESSTNTYLLAILFYRQTFTPDTKTEITHLEEDQRKKIVSTTKILLKTATTQR
jgi:hypothetical protein